MWVISKLTAILGQRAASEGSVRHIRPVRARHSFAGQEASPRDEDQAAHAESALERDLLLRRVSRAEAAVAHSASARV